MGTDEMQHEFKPDLSHTTWERVYARQERKLPLAQDWVAALAPQPGERVLDLGAGPGRFSQLLADAVGPAGRVYAVDRADAALAYLRDRITSDVIMPVLADARHGLMLPEAVTAALATDMLHHTVGQEEVLAALYGALAPGGRAVVAEFDPDTAGEVGPPLQVRVSRQQVSDWLAAAGFRIVRTWSQPMEHYALLVER